MKPLRFSLRNLMLFVLLTVGAFSVGLISYREYVFNKAVARLHMADGKQLVDEHVDILKLGERGRLYFEGYIEDRPDVLIFNSTLVQFLYDAPICWLHKSNLPTSKSNQDNNNLAGGPPEVYNPAKAKANSIELDWPTQPLPCEGPAKGVRPIAITRGGGDNIDLTIEIDGKQSTFSFLFTGRVGALINDFHSHVIAVRNDREEASDPTKK